MMSEFVWRDTYRIICEEISRGDQFALWRDIQKLPHEPDATIANETHAEILTIYSTVAVYEMVNGNWEAVNGDSRVSLPMTHERLRALPRTLASGWVAAALEENGSVFEVLDFPTARLRISQSGNVPKPESESSPA